MNYGIRVKNPLTKPVRVVITGILGCIMGQAIVEPGQTKLIPVGKGEYDISTTILEKAGQAYDELGTGSWQVSQHEDVISPVKPDLLQDEITLNGRFWKSVVSVRISTGCIGDLLQIETSNPGPGVTWRLRIGPQNINAMAGITTFNNCQLTSGQVVSVQAKGQRGDTKTKVKASILVREISLSSPIVEAEHQEPPRKAIKPQPDDEDKPLKSLAEMMEEMRARDRQEVKV